MRKAIFNHMHGAGGTWQGQVIDVDVDKGIGGPIFKTYDAYLGDEKGRVYDEELTWLDEVEPTAGELLDAVMAQEDVVLVTEDGTLTEAGALYVLDMRASTVEVWVIEDWMGNRIFPAETFDSFESARDRISEYADEVADDEDDYDGIMEDLYAVLQDDDK